MKNALISATWEAMKEEEVAAEKKRKREMGVSENLKSKVEYLVNPIIEMNKSLREDPMEMGDLKYGVLHDYLNDVAQKRRPPPEVTICITDGSEEKKSQFDVAHGEKPVPADLSRMIHDFQKQLVLYGFDANDAAETALRVCAGAMGNTAALKEELAKQNDPNYEGDRGEGARSAWLRHPPFLPLLSGGGAGGFFQGVSDPKSAPIPDWSEKYYRNLSKKQVAEGADPATVPGQRLLVLPDEDSSDEEGGYDYFVPHPTSPQNDVVDEIAKNLMAKR